jgi:hypothetical protein
MKDVSRTVVRAKQNYEDKKEKWLLQVASDPDLPRAGHRVAIAIGVHMNRKQNLLAWPGYGRLAKLLGVSHTTAVNGVSALERAKHLRVVRVRQGTKNCPNHYHPNLWITQEATEGVVTTSRSSSHNGVTRVVTTGLPEPTNEPTREPLSIRKERFVWRESPIAQPKASPAKPSFRRLVPTSEVMEILGVVPRGFGH